MKFWCKKGLMFSAILNMRHKMERVEKPIILTLIMEQSAVTIVLEDIGNKNFYESTIYSNKMTNFSFKHSINSSNTMSLEKRTTK